MPKKPAKKTAAQRVAEFQTVQLPAEKKPAKRGPNPDQLTIDDVLSGDGTRRLD